MDRIGTGSKEQLRKEATETNETAQVNYLVLPQKNNTHTIIEENESETEAGGLNLLGDRARKNETVFGPLYVIQKCLVCFYTTYLP